MVNEDKCGDIRLDRVPETVRWGKVQHAARFEGFDAGVRALYSALGATAPIYGRTGYALAPASLTGEDPAGILPTPVALEGLDTVARRKEAARASAEPSAALTTGLMWLRLGLSAGLLDAVVRHLAGRMAGDKSLLHQQMVTGTLADATIEHLEIQTALSAADEGDVAIVADLHESITRVGRLLLRLLGAEGFVAGGPGQLAHASELLADVYGGMAVPEPGVTR